MDSHLIRGSLWKNRKQRYWSFLCPLCKVHRKVSLRQRPGGIHYLQVFLSTLMVTLLFWNWFNWKGLVSFLPLWSVFEVVYRWRMRVILVCSQCGFDPYLFLINHEWARREVENHWRKKLSEKGIPYPEKTKKNPTQSKGVFLNSQKSS